MLFFVILKMKFRFASTTSKLREIFDIVGSIITTIDIIYSLSYGRGLIVSKFIRVLRVIVSFRQLRNIFKTIILVMWDSAQILFFIIAYIFGFAWIGYRLFRGTIEGNSGFNTLQESVWSLTIFLTTSNSPGLALESYKMSTTYILFFVVYLIFGLYFLMNLFLAAIYHNYKNRLEKSLVDFEQHRSDYLKAKFIKFDHGNKGYLTNDECKNLLIELLRCFTAFDGREVDVDEFIALLDRDSDLQVTLEDFFSLFDIIDVLKSQKGSLEERNEWQTYDLHKFYKIFKHPFYELFVYL